MNEFRAFVRKEFTHIFRDRRTLLILIILPIVLITLFGFALSVEIRNINVGVLSPQKDAIIEKIVHKINANPYFTVTERLDSVDEIDLLMKKGKIDVALIFDDYFGSKLLMYERPQLNITLDGSDPSTTSVKTMYIMEAIQSFFQENQSYPTSMGGITANIHMLYNPQLRSSYNFVPGIMGLILILICALMTSVSIVKERETGTMEVILVSPIKPITIIFAKMAPYFVVSCVVLLIIFVMSFILLKIPLIGSLLGITFISLLYIILSLAIGLLVSTFAKSQLEASLITAVLFMLPLVMLSGMIFPIESMPGIFRIFSCIIPARWYISSIRKLMIEGLSIHYVLKEIAILSSMILLVLTLAFKKFNDRL